uniref:Cystatin domain-containing protein n=1 Tax=Stomoxys calcitrans TaxID=35570 RepID=A0A1I8PJ37_STOCA
MHTLYIAAVLAAICVAINAQVNFPEPQVIQPLELHNVGGRHKLEGDDIKEAEDELTKSLTKIASGENGPHYRLEKIHAAYKAIVAGFRYDINADLVDDDNKGETKNCDVQIWSKPVNEGSRVTFKCYQEPVVVREHEA